MNRQTSIVTSRCQATDEESNVIITELINEAESVRRVLLPNPTGDGDSSYHKLGSLTTKSIRKVCDAIPIISPDGFGFYVILAQKFRVDFVAGGGVRIYNYSSKSAVYFNDMNEEVAAISPYGRVHRYKDIVTGMVEGKVSKMALRGVSFTAQGKPIVYLVDNAGCKSTTDKFRFLFGDMTSQILLRRRLTGPKAKQIVQNLIDEIRKESDSPEGNGLERWSIANFVFTLTPTGVLTVIKPNSRFYVAIDMNGQVKVKIDRITLILRNQFALFVKFNSGTHNLNGVEVNAAEQSVKIEHSRLTAKCAHQRAVLDQGNQLVLSSN